MEDESESLLTINLLSDNIQLLCVKKKEKIIKENNDSFLEFFLFL